MVQSVVELYSESSIGGSVCIGALLRQQLPRMLPLSRNESFGVDEYHISYRIQCVTRFDKEHLANALRASHGGCVGEEETCLILPVVICFLQRLSHACLSISVFTAIVYSMVASFWVGLGLTMLPGLDSFQVILRAFCAQEMGLSLVLMWFLLLIVSFSLLLDGLFHWSLFSQKCRCMGGQGRCMGGHPVTSLWSCADRQASEFSASFVFFRCIGSSLPAGNRRCFLEGSLACNFCATSPAVGCHDASRRDFAPGGELQVLLRGRGWS